MISSRTARRTGPFVRRRRRLSNQHANREVRWDVLKKVPCGWGNVTGSSVGLKAMEYFYKKWQFWGAKRPGRPRGQEDRFWGVDRPGTSADYIDHRSAREDVRDGR